ncbi:hypothetical protein GBL97_16430 [Yersinia pseudotuberculosis]|nr:hypothetical protein EGX52_20935 [Yersinia pseudotuberculosis]MBO1567237.1 hypothetical protein [Yersinia pseudotuberculosis]MBO1604096.1 hypothetical protein [Yersinia pseudotuberculosis]
METRCKLRYLHLDRCACHTELSIFRYASACAFTTFGWVLPRPDLGGWQDSGSFSTHANVESKKPSRLWLGLESFYL